MSSFFVELECISLSNIQPSLPTFFFKHFVFTPMLLKFLIQCKKLSNSKSNFWSQQIDLKAILRFCIIILFRKILFSRLEIFVNPKFNLIKVKKEKLSLDSIKKETEVCIFFVVWINWKDHTPVYVVLVILHEMDSYSF